MRKIRVLRLQIIAVILSVCKYSHMTERIFKLYWTIKYKLVKKILTPVSRILEKFTIAQLSKKFPTQKAHYHVHNTQPLDAVFSHLNLFTPSQNTSGKFVHCHPQNLCQDLSTLLLSSSFLTKILYAFSAPPCMLHVPPITPYLINLIIFGKE
jgi:hypothetical protein